MLMGCGVVCRLPFVRLPLEKPISLLEREEDAVPPILVGMTDPFLYNPRRLTAGQVRWATDPFNLVPRELTRLLLLLGRDVTRTE